MKRLETLKSMKSSWRKMMKFPKLRKRNSSLLLLKLSTPNHQVKKIKNSPIVMIVNSMLCRSINKKFSHYEKKDKSKYERRCFRCGDPNHFIQDCPKPPSKENKNNTFVGGAWSNSGDENDDAKEEKCLMAFGTNEVHSDSTYCSDTLIDNYDNLKMRYDGLCDLSSKVIDKNRSLKAKIKELENELLENDLLKCKIIDLEKEVLEIKNFNDVLIEDSNDLRK
ncbi:hypothetical protein L1987_18279 [Smallanthus sonchifolius]|uniref:Uncharacterized protein n=1 Tax=Smallanthus sonchifolius TaxID=185202 RepID=A0ACB9J0S8_9ASTR|nr:hypothetical protein L1987_18279 [Smallanthus sonchifolius]